MSRTVAFIGLGAMGMPMARRLVENQFRVQGFDLNPKALEVHAAQGGIAASLLVVVLLSVGYSPALVSRTNTALALRAALMVRVQT